MDKFFNAVQTLFIRICTYWSGQMIMTGLIAFAIAGPIATIGRAIDLEPVVGLLLFTGVFVPVYVTFIQACRRWQFERTVREIDVMTEEELRKEAQK